MAETRYLLYFACCEVLAQGVKGTLCWICNEYSGSPYYEIFGKVPMNQQPYRETSSRVYSQMSQVTSEFRKCPHP